RVRGALRAARLAELASRKSGRGAGGVIGGRVLMALIPNAAHALARGRPAALISGTNGKTTTTAYLAAALRTLGPVDTNADGANTQAGLFRTLGLGSAPNLVLETDEGWLPWALREVQPTTTALLNLSRDQLHRHHEVAHLADTWRVALEGAAHVVANADDPAVVMAALSAKDQTWVGSGTGWTGDSQVCPRCGDECVREHGDWGCRKCSLRRPERDWWIEGDDLVSTTDRISLRLTLPGVANRANAATAVAAAARFGVPARAAVEAIRGIASVAGRYHFFEREHHRARLLLAKNPASWVEALEMVSESDAPLVLAFNSEGVDGRDPSWLYDVPFACLADREVVVTGRRATDMHVRLEMDGFTGVRVAPDVAAAIAMLPHGEVNVLANYTAFQDARKVLGHGH
ncbi:MAG: MurT ligase domain-containing protein, partial [Actinomycetota bacterium]|nr:MurT ligase domain-containing protein [Actinomycetota bacterium]